jgi:hypothetical protein
MITKNTLHDFNKYPRFTAPLESACSATGRLVACELQFQEMRGDDELQTPRNSIISVAGYGTGTFQVSNSPRMRKVTKICKCGNRGVCFHAGYSCNKVEPNYGKDPNVSQIRKYVRFYQNLDMA